MTTKAHVMVHRAPMHDDLVVAKVCEHIAHLSVRNGNGELSFDPMQLLEDRCGRLTRGAHKGKLRGWVHIKVVSRGGWLKKGPGYMNGRVVRPDQVIGFGIYDFHGKPYLEMGV